jgi:hypothetical protein
MENGALWEPPEDFMDFDVEEVVSTLSMMTNLVFIEPAPSLYLQTRAV